MILVRSLVDCFWAGIADNLFLSCVLAALHGNPSMEHLVVASLATFFARIFVLQRLSPVSIRGTEPKAEYGNPLAFMLLY